jgi:uncharacterized repeat protein (TIGR03803 family)
MQYEIPKKRFAIAINLKRRAAYVLAVFGTTLMLAAAASIATAAPIENVLHAFSGPDGANPRAGLTAWAGNLYGTTEYGGASGTGCGGAGCGVVFEISPDGSSYQVLHSFIGTDGQFPEGSLYVDGTGEYGTTYSGGTTKVVGGSPVGTVFKLAPTGIEEVLHTFTGVPPDGANPEAGLYADSNRNLYGTTTNAGKSGAGEVFRVTSSGTFDPLHSFTGINGLSPGEIPVAGLYYSKDYLYGTTNNGGASNDGVVFKLSLSGAYYKVLHTFTGTDPDNPQASDGANPEAGLIADSKGNLYGTTLNGGSKDAGTVFMLAPGGAETVLYSFTGGNDGAGPHACLIADSKGNLYGTTESGGAGGEGVVFELSPPGCNAAQPKSWCETPLYSFCIDTYCSDGQNPQAGLYADGDGNLYGTTLLGGSTDHSGDGVVFKLTGTGFAPPATPCSS